MFDEKTYGFAIRQYIQLTSYNLSDVAQRLGVSPVAIAGAAPARTGDCDDLRATGGASYMAALD